MGARRGYHSGLVKLDAQPPEEYESKNACASQQKIEDSPA